MQISPQEVYRAEQQPSRRTDPTPPVSSVEELAQRYHVRMDEVQRFTEEAMMAEEHPLRTRRVEELLRRVEAGTYRVDDEELLEMAERRAIADQAR